jgi:hypothetical protein
LDTVSIPDGVIEIGEGAFQKCTVLTKVVIPDSVTSIEKVAFEGCRMLSGMTIPSSVLTIGERAVGYNEVHLVDTAFVIKGSQGSAAEKYANECGIKFVTLMDEKNEFYMDFASKTMPNITDMTTVYDLTAIWKK